MFIGPASTLVQWLNLHAWLGKSDIASSSPGMAFTFQRNKMFLSCSLVKIEYCGELPWPRGSVLGLRLSGPEFWILCLEGKYVTSFISPSSQVFPAQFSQFISAQRSPFISFHDAGPSSNQQWADKPIHKNRFRTNLLSVGETLTTGNSFSVNFA